MHAGSPRLSGLARRRGDGSCWRGRHIRFRGGRRIRSSRRCGRHIRFRGGAWTSGWRRYGRHDRALAAGPVRQLGLFGSAVRRIAEPDFVPQTGRHISVGVLPRRTDEHLWDDVLGRVLPTDSSFGPNVPECGLEPSPWLDISMLHSRSVRAFALRYTLHVSSRSPGHSDQSSGRLRFARHGWVRRPAVGRLINAS